MLGSYLERFEDINHPLLGPTLWGLARWGMWLPKRGLQMKMYIIVHIIATIFVISQYIELWIIRSDLDMALRNLSVTMLSTVSVVKSGTFVVWQKYWKSIVDYISGVEKKQLSMKCETTNEIIRKYTRYSRLVTYLYWSLVAATVFTVILAPLADYCSSQEKREEIRNGSVPYPEIMSSWVPFDKTKGLGYWALVVEDILICFYGGGVVATYDSNAVVMMSFLVGQLRVLRFKCATLFDDENQSEVEKVKNIRECHEHHIFLIKYSRILNSLLSPVMFLYVIICSLMICASAIQISSDGTTSMQRIWIAEYLLALIAQLFIYCWHSNEVSIISTKVDRGVYQSGWWAQNVRIRRSLLLLGGQLRKQVVFTAGPFTKMNLPTFTAILKGSYSYYTILSNKGDAS